MPVERTDVDVAPHFPQLQLRFVDQLQWRYEIIRPLGLFEDRPAPSPAIRQRAHETATHAQSTLRADSATFLSCSGTGSWSS